MGYNVKGTRNDDDWAAIALEEVVHIANERPTECVRESVFGKSSPLFKVSNCCRVQLNPGSDAISSGVALPRTLLSLFCCVGRIHCKVIWTFILILHTELCPLKSHTNQQSSLFRFLRWTFPPLPLSRLPLGFAYKFSLSKSTTTMRRQGTGSVVTRR